MEITVTKWDDMNQAPEVPNKFGKFFAQKLNLLKKGSNAGNHLSGPPGMNLAQHANSFITKRFQTEESDEDSDKKESKQGEQS
jgi:hypothetical protein